MAFNAKLQKTVVFVGGSIEPGVETKPLRGTGFVTHIPSAESEQTYLYVVTAAHVVRPLASRYIRMSRRDGTTLDLDIPAKDWDFHPTEDVAVGQFSIDPAEVDLTVMPTETYVGRAETQFPVGNGDDVVFAGLLGLVESMGQRRIPMFRTGTIGAMYQHGIPMRLGDDIVVSVHGHLVDCRSFGGFSGSPCFVRYISGMDTTPRMGLPRPTQSTLLLGIVGGHFDMGASVALPDQEQKLSVPVAAGIAIVLPSETILEVLESEEQRENRDRHDVRLLSGTPPPN